MWDTVVSSIIAFAADALVPTVVSALALFVAWVINKIEMAVERHLKVKVELDSLKIDEQRRAVLEQGIRTFLDNVADNGYSAADIRDYMAKANPDTLAHFGGLPDDSILLRKAESVEQKTKSLTSRFREIMD